MQSLSGYRAGDLGSWRCRERITPTRPVLVFGMPSSDGLMFWRGELVEESGPSVKEREEHSGKGR